MRPFWRFLLCLPVFIVTEIVALEVANLFAGYSDNSLFFESFYRPLHLAMLLGAFSLMSVVIDIYEGNAFAYQGLSVRGPWRRNVLRGFLLGSVLVGMAVAMIAVLGRYGVSLQDGPHMKPVLLCIWVLATAAMLEEVAFRGYPFQRLVESIGAAPATLAFALLFAFVHLKNPHATAFGAINTALVGVLFSLAYFKTGSLWLPFGLHFGWNLTMGLIFGLPVSGITLFSVLVAGRSEGPPWLTGREYGIEAALTGTVAILLGMLILWIWPLGKRGQNDGPTIIGSNGI